MKFEMPKMNVEEFEIVDVIMTASLMEGGEEQPEPSENGLPLD